MTPLFVCPHEHPNRNNYPFRILLAFGTVHLFALKHPPVTVNPIIKHLFFSFFQIEDHTKIII